MIRVKGKGQVVAQRRCRKRERQMTRAQTRVAVLFKKRRRKIITVDTIENRLLFILFFY